VTVDIYNGSGTPGLAGETSQAFAALGYKTGQAANSSAQSQTVQDDTEVFYGPGTEANAAIIADDMGTTATSLTSLPAGHVEVLLGSQVTALPSGLLPFGAATVTAQDYITAAEQNDLPSADMPPASSAGTQSVGGALLGARASAPSHTTKKPSSKSSTGESNGGPTAGEVTVGPNAP
jgi:hypothetical protein